MRFVLILMSFLKSYQGARVSRRNSPAQERSFARSEIYFGSILLTTASGIARTNAGEGERTNVVYADHIRSRWYEMYSSIFSNHSLKLISTFSNLVSIEINLKKSPINYDKDVNNTQK